MADNQLFEKYGNIIPAGRVIFRENDDGDQMFIIQDGKVRISRSINGQENILAILGKGDFFGETAIVNRVKRTATATAVVDTHLLAFDRQGFHGMIEKNSKIAMNIIDKLCRRLQNANMQIRHLKHKNEASLTAVNLLYAFESLPEGTAAVPKDKTVEEISLSLEMPAGEIEKIVETFVSQGILEAAGGGLRLADKEKLSLLAEKKT